ncbi:MAG: hypothetical protein QW424_02770 [Candidatus Bathyarchaeia archaeon]
MIEVDVVTEVEVTIIIILAVFSLLISGPPALIPPGSIRYLMLASFLVAVFSATSVLILYVEDRRKRKRPPPFCLILAAAPRIKDLPEE